MKRDRPARLQPWPQFRFVEMDSANAVDCAALFAKNRFSAVVRLAAQAGVRYSLENPAACINSHLVALGHVVEGCRQQRTPHLIHAGSSSVYGAHRSCPSPRRTPVSLYGATKKTYWTFTRKILVGETLPVFNHGRMGRGFH